MDKNNNGIKDKYEAIATYIIASICIVFAFVRPENSVTLLGIAAALSGARDLKLPRR